ncbi:hypothetical protein ACFSTD_01870 [Novosphingobium colocasiae]
MSIFGAERGKNMDFDPGEYGLLDDGSTIETITAQIQEGMVEEAVAAFQEVFAEYRPEGFKMLFSAVDVAHKRLIWVHRYAPGFDLKKIASIPVDIQSLLTACGAPRGSTRWRHCPRNCSLIDGQVPLRAWSRRLYRDKKMTDKIKTIEELAAGRNVELKIYTIKPGGWTNFFYYWRKNRQTASSSRIQGRIRRCRHPRQSFRVGRQHRR